MGERIRLDELLVARGLAPDEDAARRLVMAGQVRVGEEVAVKPARLVDPEREIRVERGERYVSRGGKKLEAALEAFDIPVDGRICADVGASTGGFTDCLLQHGASRVYAVDVGKGLLHWRLRNDERVTVLEGTNARNLENLPETVQLLTVDVSFISLRSLLPVVVNWLQESGDLVALIKPQFEARPQEIKRGGVVADEEVRARVVKEVVSKAGQVGLAPQGLMRSPLRGPKGNVEFLLWGRRGAPRAPDEDLFAVLSAPAQKP